MVAQLRIEFFQVFSELDRLTRREAGYVLKLKPYQKKAQRLLAEDPVCGNALLGILACLERNFEAMHAHHKRAVDLDDTCFALVYYAVSLEKSCLWSEAVRFGLLAVDCAPENAKIIDAVLKLAPLTGRFSLFKTLLPHWQQAHGGNQHPCQHDHEIVSDLLSRHGLHERDLKDLLAAIGSALSDSNVVLQDFCYEIVSRGGAAPFLHFRFVIADDLVASAYEDLVDAKLAQVLYHPRLHDAFSFSIENAPVYQLLESMERELKESGDAVRAPDPETFKRIEALLPGAPAVNETGLRFHEAFEMVLDELVTVVAKEKQRDPENYRKSPQTRLLTRIYRTIRQEIPGDPHHAAFYQGGREGYSFRDWKRAKPSDKYRMFFKHLKEENLLVFTWINSEVSPAKYRSQMDTYRAWRLGQRQSPPASNVEPEPGQQKTVDVIY